MSDEGASAASYVSSGRLEHLHDALPRLDVAFVRFGVTDRKRNGVSGCIRNLRELCYQIAHHYPEVYIVVETGIWVDYPEHYMWDRNAKLAPLYGTMRDMAASEGYPVVDVFASMRAETERGNWDLRVRGIPNPAHTIIDTSFDEFFDTDPAFFTHIHPNSRCMGLIAEWEIQVLKKRFPTRLPTP
jgi:acyl-CoA thioesterase-1